MNKSEVDVQYVFKRSHRKLSGLVIIFSAFPSKGQPPMYKLHAHTWWH